MKFGDKIQSKDDTLLYIGLSNTGQHLHGIIYIDVSSKYPAP